MFSAVKYLKFNSSQPAHLFAVPAFSLFHDYDHMNPVACATGVDPDQKQSTVSWQRCKPYLSVNELRCVIRIPTQVMRKIQLVVSSCVYDHAGISRKLIALLKKNCAYLFA